MWRVSEFDVALVVSQAKVDKCSLTDKTRQPWSFRSRRVSEILSTAKHRA
jgi:hypothetical protein